MQKAFILVLLALPAMASAQRVTGRVVDAATEKPIASVDIRLETADGVAARAVSDSLGRFILRANTGAGRYRVTTAHLGYAPTTSEVELSLEFQLDVLLRLAVQPTELPPLIVVARSRAPDAALERVGFYERQAGRFGVFLGPEEIERRRAQQISDLFRGINGVRVIYAGIRGNDIRMTRGEDPNCQPRVYLDGVIVRRGGRAGQASEQPLDVLVTPADLRAVEVFRGPTEIPQQYNAQDVTCGLVLIWTQRGARSR